MKHESFVYKWTNIKSGRFYIGKHKGTPDDGYISSGKTFLECYNAEPSMYKREILFYGTDRECLKEEGRLVSQAINMFGYSKIYNRTHWEILKGWKRTCLHCGAIVDPANEEWAAAFELTHFENCQSINAVNEPVLEKSKKLSQREWRKQREEFLLNQSKNKKNKKTMRLTPLQQRKIWGENKKSISSTHTLR